MRQIRRKRGRPNKLFPRLFAGFTFRRLAAETGYSISQLIRVFSGQSTPGTDLLFKLALSVRVPPPRMAKLLTTIGRQRKEHNG